MEESIALVTMKTAILNLAFAATLAAAQPHGHDHQRFHQKKNENSPLEKRELKTEYVPAVATMYKLGDQEVSPDEAKAGLDNGLYIVVGESTPTWSSPAQPSSTAAPTTSSKQDAVFIEQVTSSSSVAATTSSSAAAATSSSASTSGSTGIDAEFPSGEIDCDTFPSDYGALAVDWLGTGGWASIQKVPDWTTTDSTISDIVAGVSGDGCGGNGVNTFCSYACPAGYVKTQWPEAQGSTGQSVGGLLCNTDNKLELTRTAYKTLCQKGVGGVTVKNEMSVGESICRTDYPGSEAMVVPLWVEPGATADLANVASADYYVWEGKTTTLQYYVNQKGVDVEDACVWTSPAPHEDDCGNWGPVNIGVGKDSSGITYLSIFANSPTSTATLDFDIEISGDITGDCWVKSGSYYGGGTGCTTAIADGGSAVITLKDSS